MMSALHQQRLSSDLAFQPCRSPGSKAIPKR
jgi:hypothetical protein